MKKMILAALAACMCVCLCFGIFAACDDRSGNGEQPAEYTITANNGTGYTVDAPASAKEGDTVTVTVSVSDELRTVQSVTANGTACTAGTDGSYTFTMPAENVTVAVSLGYIQTEILKGELISWRSDTPAQIAKAREEDASWASYRIYFDFAQTTLLSGNNGATVTTLNPDIIPQDALDDITWTGDGSFKDSGSILIDVSKINLGTAYIAVNIKSSSPRADETIIKKLEVVEYGKVETPETWNETVILEITNDVWREVSDKTLTLNIFVDTMGLYGLPACSNNFEITEQETTVTIKYYAGYYFNVQLYYIDDDEKAQSIPLLNTSISQFGKFESPRLSFTLPDASISLQTSNS